MKLEKNKMEIEENLWKIPIQDLKKRADKGESPHELVHYFRFDEYNFYFSSSLYFLKIPSKKVEMGNWDSFIS